MRNYNLSVGASAVRSLSRGNPRHSTIGLNPRLARAVAPLVEAMELRTLLSASVSGSITEETNPYGPTGGTFESADANVTVYADLNNNGALDSGEPSAVTNNNGGYTLTSVPTGAQIIRQIAPTGQRQRLPTAVAGNHVTVASTAITGVNFTDTNETYITGTIYNDANGNTKQDAGEAGLAGLTVVALQGNVVMASGVTDSSGIYSIDGVNAGTYTVTDAAAMGTTAGDVTLTVSAAQVVTNVNVANTTTVAPTPVTLTGTVIGTAGSYNNSGNTIGKVFDGNLSNFFDGPTANGNYAGLDLGSAKVITQLSYAPRTGYGSRMVGGVFQGSDSADFSGPVTTLYTVTASPASQTFTTVNVSSVVPFRYVRYLSPNGSYGDVGEVRFTGYTPAEGATLSSNGTLAIYGTSGSDQITAAPDPGYITTGVIDNTVYFSFPTNSVTQIIVGSLGGNDTIAYSASQFDDPQAALPPVTLSSGDGDDSITLNDPAAGTFVDAGAGNDTIIALNDGAATLNGGDGDDTISSDGASLLTLAVYGNEGNDTLSLGEDSSGTLSGGAGNDMLIDSSNLNAVVSGGDGTDTFDSEIDGGGSSVINLDGKSDSGLESTDTLEVDTDIETIGVGLNGNDVGGNWVINGNSAANNIDINVEGSVTVNGGDGNDTIFVGDGSTDPNFGGEAFSADVTCGSGNNDVTVLASEATLNGGSGDDTLTAYNGHDILISGGGGNNVLYVAGPAVDNATINGGTGNDTITTAEGDFLNITGGSGSNVISVGGGDSSEPDVVDPYSVTITGGAGGDTITGSAFYATINGGSGNDSINYDGQDGLDIEAGNGNNTITAASGHLLVNGGSGNDVIRDVTQSVFDSAGNPTATLNGGAGNDTIYADRSDGETGYPDMIDGGADTDTAYIDPRYDTVVNVEHIIDYPGTNGGTISGTVTNGKAGETIYLDANNNSTLDSGELSTTLQTNGTFSFTNVPAGAYVVRQVLPSGYKQTSPTNNYGDHVTVTNGSTSAGNNFTDSAPATGGSISGTVAGGKAGETIYLDTNNDSKLDNGELSTTTAANGTYNFSNVPVGATIIRQVLPSGYTQTTPSGGLGIHVTVTQDGSLTNENFVDRAPAAVHTQLTGTTIGTAGSYNNSGNTIAKATDENLSTFFDAQASNGDWVGFDLGSSKSINQIAYAPRSGYASRMTGGEIQISTTADFSSGVTTIYTITGNPAAALTTVTLSSPVTARYIRYLSPNSSHGDIAEFQVFS